MKLSEQTSKTILTSILLGISLLIALILESRMVNGAAFELVVIFVGSLLFAAVLAGLWLQEEWAQPLCILLFVLALANLIWLFTTTKSLLGLGFGLIVNIAGLVLSLSSTEMRLEPSLNLETYDALNSVSSEFSVKRKRGRPPKNASFASQ